MGMAAMSLRGRKGEESLEFQRMVSFRCPDEVRAYIKSEREKSGRKEAKVIVQALELDRDLGLKLADEEKRLDAYAQANGLDFERDLAEVLARLVRAGLDATEKKGKK